MLDDKKVLAVVPARGGSKGLPGKNIRPLAGKPLIGWSIEAGLGSRYIDKLVVSTDSEKIATIARDHGAEVPFMRPAELASDQSRGIDVILHALKWFAQQGQSYEVVAVLQPTSPLRTAQDIDLAFELFREKAAKAVVSVCQTEHHPWWSNTLPEDGSMEDFLRPELLNRNRQELPKYYRLNGAIYIADTEFLQEKGSFLAEGTYAYPMEAEKSVDIDTMTDFRLAELLLQEKLLST